MAWLARLHLVKKGLSTILLPHGFFGFRGGAPCGLWLVVVVVLDGFFGGKSNPLPISRPKFKSIPSIQKVS
jgi:hypothetical protein